MIKLGEMDVPNDAAVDATSHLVGQMGTEAFQRALDAEADVIIAKNRNGPTDTVNLTWIKESMRFTNHSHLDEPDGGYFADSGNDSF